MSCLIVTGILVLLPTLSVRADDSIDTDGPNYVGSSGVVGVGRFQYEAEVEFQADRRFRPAVRTDSTPFLLKYGIADGLELRLDAAGVVAVAGRNGQPGAVGLGDTALGVKWHAQDADDARLVPAASWIFECTLPSGSSGFTSPGVRPLIRTVLTWGLPRDLALAVMPGVASGTLATGAHYLTASVGVSLTEHFTDRLGVFLEVSVPQLAQPGDGGNLVYRDLGAAWLLTRDTQIGGRLGFALNANTPGSYILFELDQRF